MAMKIVFAAASILVPLGIFVIHQVIRGNKLSAFTDNLDNFKTNKKLVEENVNHAEGIHEKLEEKKEEDTTPPFTGYRLPKDIIPKMYDLHLKTDLEAGTFEGTVDIEVACVTPTSVIRLHSRGLEIDVENVRVNELVIKGVEVPKEDSEEDFLVIKLTEQLPVKSDHIVSIPFSGRLGGGPTGYHLLQYKQLGNNQVNDKLLAVTQFEPAHARKAFPCFDEPHLKANFTIHLGHKKEYKAVSNMPLRQTTEPEDNGWVWDDFMTSSEMSTYTVAFVVSDLELVNFVEEGKDSISYEILSRSEMRSQVAFIRDSMPKLLEKCQAFFKTEFPLKRLTLGALPNLSLGAKESWGLITFREVNILMDVQQSTDDAKFQAETVLAHELAQQWIGNLVTMKWWSDYWLTKAIAAYAASTAVYQLNSGSSGFHDYNLEMARVKVFSLDSFESSSPISLPIENPRNINPISDDMTYYKGLLVINMISSTVGLAEFQAGVGAYIKEFQYKTAGQEEFWNAVTTATGDTEQFLPSGVSLKQVVDSWTTQAGYPVLTVKREGESVTVSQKRHFKGKPKSEDAGKGCWFVPVTFGNDKHLEFTTKPTSNMWLSCDKREVTFETGLPNANFWMVLNNRASGIYRVNYDEKTWEVLAVKLLSDYTRSRIPVMNWMQLISDAMEMAYVGQLSYQKAFGVLRSITTATTEYSLLPWQAAMISLEELRNLLIRTEKFEAFKLKVQTILSPLFSRYYYITQYSISSLPLSKITSLAYVYGCKYEILSCQLKTKSAWYTSFKGPFRNSVSAVMRDTVYCEAVRQGGTDMWDKAYSYYRESNIATEKRLFLYALACTKLEDQLRRLLDLSLDETSGIPKEDSWRVFWMTADYSILGFEVALKFLQEKLETIYNYNKPNTSVLAKYFEVLAKKLVYKDEIDQMKEFATKNKNLLEDSWTGVTQAMEQMDINLQWHETHYKTIQDYFQYL